MDVFTRKDYDLMVELALPAAAGSVTSTPIQLQPVGKPCLLEGELEIIAPDMTTGQLPDAATAVYAIVHGDDPESLNWLATIGTLTGAGGAGSVGSTWRFRPPSTCKSYVALKVTTSAAVDVSALKANIDVVV